jgi:cytochrome P450 family 2 subfamily J
MNAVLNELKDGDGRDCFVQRFVEASQRQPQKDQTSGFDRLQLKSVLFDFFSAGTDTTATALRWAVSLLADHPRVQSRLQTELDSVLPAGGGSLRLPSLDDAPRLPYAEAVILETMRIHTIFTLSLLRSTTCDTQVGGFFIPAETMVS